LALLFLVLADVTEDVRHVASVFFLRFDESLVIVADDGVIGFLEISQILLTLREREIGRQLIILTQELRLLRLAQFLVLFQRYLWRGRQFVHRLADWADDGVPVQVIEAGPAFRILAGALGPARCFGRHLKSSTFWVGKFCCRLPRATRHVKNYCHFAPWAAVDSPSLPGLYLPSNRRGPSGISKFHSGPCSSP